MLDSLSGIPWSKLRCQTGFAGHVPDAVLGLMSDDLDVIETSYWQLENRVVAQGALYEAAGYLPPVLFEAFDKAPLKWSILELLFQIGNGDAFDDPELEDRCHNSVISGLKHWLSSNANADLKLHNAVGDVLRELLS
jgi:hypothetical protein